MSMDKRDLMVKIVGKTWTVHDANFADVILLHAEHSSFVLTHAL